MALAARSGGRRPQSSPKMYRMSAPKHRSKTPTDSRPGHAGRGPAVRRVKVGQREIFTHGLSQAVLHDLFHYCMTVSWPQLFATLAAFFLAFDVLFGLLYHLVPGCIANLNPPGFAGAFFSVSKRSRRSGTGTCIPRPCTAISSRWRRSLSV